MQPFEYKHECIEIQAPHPSLLEHATISQYHFGMLMSRLNFFGKVGWELTGYTYYPSTDHSAKYHCVFKRTMEKEETV